MSTNIELKKFVLANLPIQDARRVRIRGYRPKPTTSHKYEDTCPPFLDVTKQVQELLKEGKIKRQRKYGFGHSGHAGHTVLVVNAGAKRKQK